MKYRVEYVKRNKRELPAILGLLCTRIVREKSEANAIFIAYKCWLEDMGYKRIRANQAKHLDVYVYLEMDADVNTVKKYYYTK